MSRFIIIPKTVADAWELYVEYLKTADPNIIPLAQTALFRYTLPGYGLPRDSRTSAALQFMKQIPLHQFVEALNVQQKVFDFLELRKSGQRANRHRLKQMLTWCSQQDWWKLATKAEAGQFAPRRRNNLGNAHHVKLTEQKQTSRWNYSLRILDPEYSERLKKFDLAEEAARLQEEAPRLRAAQERLQEELRQLRRFQTSILIRDRQNKSVTQETANKTETLLYLIFGWLYLYEREAPEALTLERLVDIDVAYDYTEWQRDEREVTPATELQALIALLNVAKFKLFKDSDRKQCEILCKPYVDIEIIGQLRKLIRDTNQRVKDGPITVSDESQKWLTWPEFLACVEYLKQDCGLLTSDGERRSNRAIARSHERYLIAALLAYMPPDRQRTFRELEEGRTLVRGIIKNNILHRKSDGCFHIKLGPSDYKTGSTYKEQILQVPEQLQMPLEEWLTKWRKTLNPNHNFVFTQLNGKPLTGGSLYQLFRHAIYRASVVLFGEGRATNPHLVRDMLVTHFYEIGASEAALEGLAIGMKHSRKTQRERYDRRTKQNKVKPALEVLEGLKAVEVSKSILKVVQLDSTEGLLKGNDSAISR